LIFLDLSWYFLTFLKKANIVERDYP